MSHQLSAIILHSPALRAGNQSKYKHHITKNSPMIIRSLFAVLLFTAFSTNQALSTPPDWNLSLKLDLGPDLGQNYGTLFELTDDSGTTIAGAGYVGSYNTQSRSDRRALHFFVKSSQATDFNPEPLPRPSTDAGTYLYDFQDKLFSLGRGGNDQRHRQWNTVSATWQDDNQTAPFSVAIADGILSADQRGYQYNGKPILEVQAADGILAENYYANGHLVFRRRNPQTNPPVNELVAVSWNNKQATAPDWKSAPSIPMRTPREFVYAYGQLADQVVAATNTGGFYTFDGKNWNTVLEPDTNVSFQIYAIINYRDRLLCGQYPTGELFSYDGKNLTHIPDWPPAVPCVQKRAREAQTLTIYGGDLYCGVWPWGEVWKLAKQNAAWQFAGRMFTHPALTDETTHPYETETSKLGSVLNRWGQRVTSLVPIGDSLYISTSSKGGNAYDPKFTFLAGDKWKEYGSVYQFSQPGAIVVPTTWTTGPTNFDFKIHQGKLQVFQDGKLLGFCSAPTLLKGEMASANVKLAKGLFGPYRGKNLQQPTPPSPSP